MMSADQNSSAGKKGVDPSKDKKEGADMEIDEDVPAVTGPVTFEEVLLLRLTFELNRSNKSLRSPYYLERLLDIVPEFDDYRKITLAIVDMDEENLPEIDYKDEDIKPYPAGQQGFNRRAILGEWIKFCMQLNL